MTKTMKAAVVRRIRQALDHRGSAGARARSPAGVRQVAIRASGRFPATPTGTPPRVMAGSDLSLSIPGPHQGVGFGLGVGVGASSMSGRATGWACPAWPGAAGGHCRHCLGGWETLCESQKNTGYWLDG